MTTSTPSPGPDGQAQSQQPPQTHQQPPPQATRTEGSTRRHPPAPSLDIIATQTEPQQDSRSSSSTNSPAPNEYEESDFFLVPNDSQSSLGVPNLQDMAVSDDDECLPPINRLPNEILISIFARLVLSSDQLHCMLTCKRWARNVVDQLWHRPSCTSWGKHAQICQTLGLENPYFSYKDFIKRLNLASLSEKVNDGSVLPLSVCTRVERLTLPNCKKLTDHGLIELVRNNAHLLALDISHDDEITEASVFALAESCRRLQGLNMSGCTKVSNESLVQLAENCRFIKRLKLNDCRQVGDEAICAFAEHCPNLLEIDLERCRLIGNVSVTSLLAKGQALRELRLVNCELIDDVAFLSLPPGRSFEFLRILDLTSCSQLTDRGVQKIIEAAPRLRNLVLSKCRNITDAAVFAIAELRKNLHYVHLGHCNLITDEAVKRLVHYCTRIRYIDLGCCVHLTDESVTRLAQLPKLKRIGLVKCSGITDESIIELARANQRGRHRRDAMGNPINQLYIHSSLERVHLSYCTNLTLKGIIRLLNACPRLTHLSLTGVEAFLREDLSQYCRDAPPEFTEHQRNMFCVFSGNGVVNLRAYLNTQTFADLHDRGPYNGGRRHSTPGSGAQAPGSIPPPPPAYFPANLDASFDGEEPDQIEDDDGMEDVNEMAIDPPLLAGGVPIAGTAPPQTGVPGPPLHPVGNPSANPSEPGAPPQNYLPGGMYPGPNRPPHPSGTSFFASGPLPHPLLPANHPHVHPPHIIDQLPGYNNNTAGSLEAAFTNPAFLGASSARASTPRFSAPAPHPLLHQRQHAASGSGSASASGSAVGSSSRASRAPSGAGPGPVAGTSSAAGGASGASLGGAGVGAGPGVGPSTASTHGPLRRPSHPAGTNGAFPQQDFPPLNGSQDDNNAAASPASSSGSQDQA